MKNSLIFILLLHSGISYSQSNGSVEEKDQETFKSGGVLEIGVGSFSSAKASSGFSANIGFKVIPTPNNIFKLRYNYYNEFILFTTSNQDFNEFNLMVGYQKTFEFTRIATYIGAGVFSGTLRGDIIPSTSSSSDPMGFGWITSTKYESIPFTTIGVPIEIELSLLPYHLLGLCISVNGNINTVNPLMSLSVKLEFGR